MKSDLIDKIVNFIYDKRELYELEHQSTMDVNLSNYYGGKLDAYDELIQLLVKGKWNERTKKKENKE